MATKKKAPTAKAAAKKKSAASRTTAAKKSPANKKSPAKKKAAAKKSTSKKAPAQKARARKKKAALPDDYPFTVDFLDTQREALLAEKGRYTQHAEFLTAEAEQLAREREPGDVQFDEESGEGDSIAVERDRDLQLSAQARDAIEEIDAALGRIEKGTYGICAVSGLPIPHERLEAIPHADMRVEFKRSRRRLALTMAMEADERERRRSRLVAAAAAVTLIADVTTKIWAVAALDDRTIDVVWKLRLQLVSNTGFAFSTGEGLGPLLGVLAAGIALLLWRTRRTITGALRCCRGGHGDRRGARESPRSDPAR